MKMSFWLRVDVDFDAFRGSYENLEDKSEWPTYESYMAAIPSHFARDAALFYPSLQLSVVETPA